MIAFPENMRDKLLVARRRNHEMQMRRAPGMPAECLQHFADRTVMRNRIRLGDDRAKVITPVGETMQDASRPMSFVARMLHVIEAVRVGLPHFDAGAGDRFAIRSRDRAGYEA